MKSFRSEIEDSIVERDIIDLEKKIYQYQSGHIDEERFRSLRLARGVYGQRQFGVQMIRIKLPFGKVTGEQLHRIANVSDEYSRGRLHITTRQDIQIHHVSLDRTPELWAKLEEDDITLREACGNTVRNVTASATAGIDKNEVFDVSPYADAVFRFFLRNPVCQEMGRKFKISFSGTDADTGLAFMNDLGCIAKIKQGRKGFKVVIAGGLGAQPILATPLYDFVLEEKLIPLIESVLRVFDSYGERNKRSRARLKFLVRSMGLPAFLDLIEKEQKALSYQEFPIPSALFNMVSVSEKKTPITNIKDKKAFDKWKKSNVSSQKQKGFFAIGVKIRLGDFYTKEARKLANLIKEYAANEIRLTLGQSLLIPYVKEENLPYFYQELSSWGFTDPGYHSSSDITACPGTDTCNLGIASSTGIALELESVLQKEFSGIVAKNDISIKISGCMNSCGQHSIAQIGFQGMSIKSGPHVAPALQVLLGGGVLGNGKGRFADKVIKIPSKRGPKALRWILRDFQKHKFKTEPFLGYYDRMGKMYFYHLLKPLSSTTNLNPEDFIDWGNELPYVKEVGIGECAGVVIDLVSTLFFESEEKILQAQEAFEKSQFSDSIYLTYNSIINTAKALLLTENKKTNTHREIVEQFEDIYKVGFGSTQSFSALVYQFKKERPSKRLALKYLSAGRQFYKDAKLFRSKSLEYEA